MSKLGCAVRGAVGALGCLACAMAFFAGVIALSDYSVAQMHGRPGAAEGARLSEIVMLVAILGGSAVLLWMARGRLRRTTVTGTLVCAADGRLYVLVPFADDAGLFWLRRLPAGHAVTESGIEGPHGARFGDGQAIRVSGVVSRAPRTAAGPGARILDVTSIR